MILKDGNVPRSQWPLGRVIEVCPDDNGVVRSVLVRTKDNVLKRPIVKLCLFVPACDGVRGDAPGWLRRDDEGVRDLSRRKEY